MVVKNDALVEIVRRFPTIPANWDWLAKRLKEEPKPLLPSSIVSRAGELHTQEALEHICSKSGITSDFNPVKEPSSTDNFYIFIDRYGHVKVDFRGSNYMECDILAVIDGLPTLFEVKIGRYRSKGKNSVIWVHGAKKRRKDLGNGHVTHPSSVGVPHAMNPQRVEYLLRPLREYFGMDCGYVLVLPSDYIKESSTTQRAFLEQNGLLATLYGTRLSLWKDALRAKLKYGI